MNPWWHHPYALEIGDLVAYIIENDSVYRHPKEGLVGKIVGFPDDSVCRWWSFKSKKNPGFYEDRRYPLVSFGRELFNIHASQLKVVDQSTYNKRVSSLLEIYPADTSGPKEKYVASLPDLNIWEGDVVRIRNGAKQPTRASAGYVLGHKNAFLISWLHFPVVLSKQSVRVESKDAPPIFSLANQFNQDNEDGWHENELELISRGNIWRQAHGEGFHPNISPEEKASFLCQSNQVEFIDPPEKGHVWSKLFNAMLQVENGLGHGIMRFEDGIGWDSTVWFRVVRFADEGLGNLIKNMTLSEGFLIPHSSSK